MSMRRRSFTGQHKLHIYEYVYKYNSKHCSQWASRDERTTLWAQSGANNLALDFSAWITMRHLARYHIIRAPTNTTHMAIHNRCDVLLPLCYMLEVFWRIIITAYCRRRFARASRHVGHRQQNGDLIWIRINTTHMMCLTYTSNCVFGCPFQSPSLYVERSMVRFEVANRCFRCKCIASSKR